MASRHRIIALFVFVLGSALLRSNALPQGYHTRFSRSYKCANCPRDCSEKLAGGNTAEIVLEYPQEEPAKPQFVAVAQPQASSPRPTPAPYVYTVLQPQPQYSAPQPQVQTQYANPPPLPYPQYSVVQPQPQYSAPQPQPQYSVVQSQPQYSVVQSQPQYSSPPSQPQYSTPSSTPRYVGHLPASQPEYPDVRPSTETYEPIDKRPEYPGGRPSTERYQSIDKRPVYPPPNNYLSQIRPPCGCPDCPQNFDPYDYSGYDYDDGGYRYGRSLDSDDSYPMFSKYNRRSVDAESKKFAPEKEYRQESLPFADESGPPADFYKNYRPYVRESNDGPEYDSEEQPSRRNANTERERLFVVYRADENGDNPSDSELESVIRQAMDVARQQKNQENFAKARKPKSINRYHYEHEMYQDAVSSEPMNFEALKEDKVEGNGETRFNLSPGPLMNDETFVTEDGDDTLNPGTDQSKWTVVPSLTDLDLAKPQMDDVEEIEAAVSVVPEPSKMTNVMRVPKVVLKDADVGDVKEKVMKETIEVGKAGEVEKKAEMEDIMQTPSIVTEATKFEKPVESSVTWSPTTNASVS